MIEYFKSLNPDWISIFYGIILCAPYYLIFNSLHNRIDFERFSILASGDKNKNSSFRSSYENAVVQIVDSAEQFFGNTPATLKSNNFTHFFNVRGFETNLKISIVYPVVCLVVFWTLWGVNTSGIVGFLPEGLEWWKRMLTIFYLVTAIALFAYALKQYGIRSMIAQLVFPIIILVPAYVLGIFAITSTLVGAILGPKFGAVVIAVLSLFAVVGAVFDSTDPTQAVQIWMVVFLVAFGIYFLRGISRRSNMLAAFYIIFVPFLMFFIFFMVGETLIEETRNLNAIVAFIIVIPLINAIFDWLSFGFTRCLVIWVKQNQFQLTNLIIAMVGDLLAAFFCLIGLTLVLTAYFAIINVRTLNANAEVFFDMPLLFNGLRNDPLNLGLLWIYVTLLSTFWPTLLHLVSFVGAWFVQIPLYRKKIKKYSDLGFEKFSSGSLLDRHAFASLLFAHFCFAWLGALVIFGVIVVLIIHGGPNVLLMVLDICESLYFSILDNAKF